MVCIKLCRYNVVSGRHRRRRRLLLLDLMLLVLKLLLWTMFSWKHRIPHEKQVREVACLYKLFDFFLRTALVSHTCKEITCNFVISLSPNSQQSYFKSFLLQNFLPRKQEMVLIFVCKFQREHLKYNKNTYYENKQRSLSFLH